MSPYYGNLDNLPPLLVQVGSRERLYDEIVAISIKAASGQNQVVLEEYDGLCHAFPLFSFLADAAGIALDRGADFIIETLSGKVNRKRIFLSFTGVEKTSEAWLRK